MCQTWCKVDHMDLVSHRLSVCVLTICLLGVARSFKDDMIKCPCSEIRHMPRTKPPPETCLESTFRYMCVDGYVRKVGTSNLSKCKRSNGAPQWTKPSLECIPDPKRTTTVTPAFPAAPHTTLGVSGISAPVAPETYGTVSTSPGVHTEFVSETRATDRTTSNSSNNSSNTTLTPHVLTYTDHRLDKTTTAVLVCISLVIICALFGVGYACHRRRSRNEPASVDERVAMNPVSVELAP